MNRTGTTHNLLAFAFFILPVIAAFGAYTHFQNQAQRATHLLAQSSDTEGKVAGALSQEVENLTGVFPMYPNAEIINVDRTEEKTSLTLSSEASQEMIEEWYANFFLTNGWKRLDNPHEYEKGTDILTAEIRDGIIRLSLIKK